MKDIIKILAVILGIAFVINFCRANFSHMKASETYISTEDKNIKIELTEEKEICTYDDGYTMETGRYVAYLYVNDEVYEGAYKMFVSNTLKKELWLSFDDHGMYHDDHPGSLLYEDFYVKRNKIVVQDKNGYYTQKCIFKENNTFYKKTWWNTWGKKIVIILAILFVLWLLKDIPKQFKDKEFREEMKDDLKEHFKEGIKEVMKEGIKDINDLK